MGLELTLSVIKEINIHHHSWLGYNRFKLDKHYDFYDKVFQEEYDPEGESVKTNEDAAPVFYMPKDVDYMQYHDEGVRKIERCLNGKPLTFTKTKYIKEKHKGKVDEMDTSDWNKNILKFLMSLKDETVIVLEWS